MMVGVAIYVAGVAVTAAINGYNGYSAGTICSNADVAMALVTAILWPIMLAVLIGALVAATLEG